MKIVLATNNNDKVKEIKAFYKDFEIFALGEIMPSFEIEETGKTFKENAQIKSNAVYEKLIKMGLDNEFISLSDDSGISVPILGGMPGIYSARFAGIHGDDAKNRQKLKQEIAKIGLKEAKAFYTACISVSSKFGNYTTHGFMYGKIIDQDIGKNGFGYDFMFVANGFNKTVAQLEMSQKLEISHRSKGLILMKYILETLKKVNSF